MMLADLIFGLLKCGYTPETLIEMIADGFEKFGSEQGEKGNNIGKRYYYQVGTFLTQAKYDAEKERQRLKKRKAGEIPRHETEM